MHLRVKLHVYTLEKMAVDLTTNQFYGDYTMMDNKTLGLKPQPQVSPYLNMIRPDYKYTGSIITQGLMKPYTVKPVEFTFKINAYGTSEEVDKLVAKLTGEVNRDIELLKAKYTKEQEEILKQLQRAQEKAAALPLNYTL